MLVLVNLKAYDCDPVAIAEAAAAVEAETDTAARLAVAPPATHLTPVAEAGVEPWSQHVAPHGPGSHTGATTAALVADAGAVGTLLNHSERRLRLAAIDDALGRAREHDLATIVCANNPEQVSAAARLGPDMVAVEPPELIGTGTPVSQADPGIVEAAVAAAADTDVDVLCGAGISTGADVRAARELGADGVLLASGVAKAADPAEALTDLVAPLG